MKYLLTILLLAVFAGAAAAQEARVPAMPAVPAMPSMPSMPDAKLYTELLASSEKVVKGAPFAADVVNESVQTLADGNRIVRASNSKMYRDSEGRFRRDGAVNSGGSTFGYFTSVLSTTITDPVGGFKYFLDDKNRSVRKWTIKAPAELNREALEKLRGKLKELSAGDGKISPEARAELEKELAAQGKALTIVTTPLAQSTQEKVELERALVGKIAIATTIPSGEAFAWQGGAGKGVEYATNTESLGAKNIEGVEAEGTRTTTTIPAGAIGNERAIEIVYEKWYSKDLQLIVYSKHSDPRYGDQTYRLTNISRSEPDPSVFAVPTEYKVLTEGYAPAAGSVYKITAATPAKAIFYASDATAPKPPTVTVKAADAPKKP